MAYSDAFVTECMIRLAVNKYDFDKTAEQMGVTARSLRNWEKSFPKKGVPELLCRAIERLLSVIPEKWDGHDWAVSLGILMDKWLLLQGEATNRTESIVRGLKDVTTDERDAIIKEAERILTETMGRSSAPGESEGGPNI
jgi:hypothetical protein